MVSQQQHEPTSQERTVWTLDTAHSSIEFTVKHMMFTTVRGRFADANATITLDEKDPKGASVEAEVSAASIDTRAQQRDEHLRGPDFFDVEKHPSLIFKSKRIEGQAKIPGDRFQIVGDLTIRDATREVTLDVTFEGQGKNPWGKEVIGFAAETRIDRRDFGLTWNQALEAGGVLVSNEVKIHLSIQAGRADG